MIFLAHEKWFVDDSDAYASDFDFLADPATIALLAGAVAYTLIWRWLFTRRLPTPELPLDFLAEFVPWIPRLLGVHLGVSLLSLAVTNSYLAPNLSLSDVPAGGAIALAEGVVGVWLTSGILLRPAAIAVVLLGPLALVLAGPVSVLEAIDLLGIAVFLILLPPGPDRYGAVEPDVDQARNALWALKVGLGVALITVALTEKLVNPHLARRFLDSYPAFDLFQSLGLGLGEDAFIRFAGVIEVLFGLLLISGAGPQAVVLIAGIPFNATLFFLGRVELIGHLPIYGGMLALLVFGSSRRYAEVIPRLTPVLKRQRPVPVSATGTRE